MALDLAEPGLRRENEQLGFHAVTRRQPDRDAVANLGEGLSQGVLSLEQTDPRWQRFLRYMPSGERRLTATRDNIDT